MTKSELIARLAERYPQLVAKDAEFAVKTILDAMARTLADCIAVDSVIADAPQPERARLLEAAPRLEAADAAAPPAPEVPPEVHADGVSELFDVFLPRSSDADRVDLGGGIRLIATDTGHVWSFGHDWRRDGDVDVAATVSAMPRPSNNPVA